MSQPDPTTCSTLYKILTPKEKDSLPTDDLFLGTEFDQKDGFIHLSTVHQLPIVLKRFFSSEFGVGDELYVFSLPRGSEYEIEKKIQFDEISSGEKFGHVYGGLIPSKDFTDSRKITRNQDGSWDLGSPALKF